MGLPFFSTLATCESPKENRSPANTAVGWGKAEKHYDVTASAGEQGSEIKVKFDFKIRDTVHHA